MFTLPSQEGGIGQGHGRAQRSKVPVKFIYHSLLSNITDPDAETGTGIKPTFTPIARCHFTLNAIYTQKAEMLTLIKFIRSTGST